jgi:hypothetical protein
MQGSPSFRYKCASFLAALFLLTVVSLPGQKNNFFRGEGATPAIPSNRRKPHAVAASVRETATSF